MTTPPARPRHRLLAVLATLIVLLIVVALLFDWNWLRGPLNRYISEKTQREFTSTDLHVRLGFTPTIRLRGVRFANAPWAEQAPMARIGEVEFSVSLRDAFEGRILVPRVAITDGDLRFERQADGRKNWVISEPSKNNEPSKLRISSLSVTRGHLQFLDHGTPFSLQIDVATFDPAAAQKAGDADAAPGNQRYTTRYAFNGKYHDASFSGEALTGDVLSFQASDILFPLRGHLTAGTTQLDVEGTVADVAQLSAIDVKLRIAGQTLGNLYPFLLLPLPASPPYQLAGHLTLHDKRYGLDDLRGKIGSTDVSGNGAYLQRDTRPLLQAKLHSELLNVADLGPLLGVQTKASGRQAPPTQAETQTRGSAQQTERQTNGDRVLPDSTPPGERLLPTGRFEGGRLKAIDVQGEYTAQHIAAPSQLNVDNVRAVVDLQDGVLKIAPLNLDIAGGRMLSTIDLDGRQKLLAARVDVLMQRLDLGHLLPKSPRLAQSQGTVNARVTLAGTGDSIADMASKSQGGVAATLSKGQISNLIDAAAGLNGGKVISLLIGGDEDIPVHCGAVNFAVQNGQGRSTLFVIDTEQTRINASGTFDLDHERFDVTVAPQPKRPGILSLRTPVRLYGSFRHPDYALDKKGLALRAGGALALGLVAPVAALIPLLETGPGDDVNCSQLAATSRREAAQAGAVVNAASAPPATSASAPAASKAASAGQGAQR